MAAERLYDVDPTPEYRREWRRLIDKLAANGVISHNTPRVAFGANAIAALYAAGPEGLYGSELRDQTGITHRTVVRMLLRWREEYGLISSEQEQGDPKKLGRPLRTYHRLTPLGREFAEMLDLT